MNVKNVNEKLKCCKSVVEIKSINHQPPCKERKRTQNGKWSYRKKCSSVSMASVFLPHSVSCILLVLCQNTVTVYKVGYSQQTRLRFKYVVNSVNFLQYERKVTTCNLFFNTLTVYFAKLFFKTYKISTKSTVLFKILSIYLGRFFL